MYRHRINITGAYVAQAFITNYFVWVLGITHLFIGVMYLLPALITISFGEQPNSQLFAAVLGITSLATGVSALLTRRKSFRLKLTTVVASSIFLWFCAAADFSRTANGLVGWVCLLQPIASISVLLAANAWAKKTKPLKKILIPVNLFVTLPASNYA